MRRLKIIVTIMSLLLVAGTGLLGYGMAKIHQEPPPAAMPSRDSAANLVIKVVPGAVIQSVAQYKGDLAIAVASPEGGYVYFYNPERRDVTRVISLDNGKKK